MMLREEPSRTFLYYYYSFRVGKPPSDVNSDRGWRIVFCPVDDDDLVVVVCLIDNDNPVVGVGPAIIVDRRPGHYRPVNDDPPVINIRLVDNDGRVVIVCPVNDDDPVVVRRCLPSRR